MGRVWKIGAGALVVLLGVAGIHLYLRFTELDVVRVTDDVQMIRGAGGNVGVLGTAAGSVVVDTMTFRLQGARIRELAESLAGGPTRAVINSHYHRDHTHGNPGFAPGTRVLATARTLDYLLALDAAYWEDGAAQTLPRDLVDGSEELRIGDKTIRLIHPGPGHTGGDLVVLFVEDRVLHTGDLFFNGRYPRVDFEAGGSLGRWITSLDRVLGLDFDQVIPGHGPLSDREGLRAFQRFLGEVLEIGQAAAAEGLSLAETLERADVTTDAGYELGGMPPFVVFDRDDVIRQAWEEATGRAQALDIFESSRGRAP
jgi:cyclase